jgi:hypothetical protein
MVLYRMERYVVHSLQYSKNFRDASKETILQIAFDASNINELKGKHIAFPTDIFIFNINSFYLRIQHFVYKSDKLFSNMNMLQAELSVTLSRRSPNSNFVCR